MRPAPTCTDILCYKKQNIKEQYALGSLERVHAAGHRIVHTAQFLAGFASKMVTFSLVLIVGRLCLKMADDRLTEAYAISRTIAASRRVGNGDVFSVHRGRNSTNRLIWISFSNK